MSQISKAVSEALDALGVPVRDLLASAERGSVVTIVTTAGQKLAYDANHPPASQVEGLADSPEEGAGASALAPTEGLNAIAAEGQVEAVALAESGAAQAAPEAATEAPEAPEEKRASVKPRKGGAK